MVDCNQGSSGGNQEFNEPGSQAGLYAYLEESVQNLDPTSTRLPKLTQLIEELRGDQERRARPCPAGGQQPYPLDTPRKKFTFRQILEWLKLVPKKKTQPKSKIGEYQQMNVTHYGEAFNVDMGGSMIESEIENKRAYYNERQEELRQRYEQRPANFAGPLYDSEHDLVPKMLAGYKRRDQEYQWRQPGSQFRLEVLTNYGPVLPELEETVDEDETPYGPVITELEETVDEDETAHGPVIIELEETVDECQTTLIGQLETLRKVLEKEDFGDSLKDIETRIKTLNDGLDELKQLATDNPNHRSAINSLIKEFKDKNNELFGEAIELQELAVQEEVDKKEPCPVVKTDFLGLAQDLLRLPWKNVHAYEAGDRLIKLERMVKDLTTARDKEWAVDHDEVARCNATKVIAALGYRIDAINAQHKEVRVLDLEEMVDILSTAREDAWAVDEEEDFNRNITKVIEALEDKIEEIKAGRRDFEAATFIKRSYEAEAEIDERDIPLDGIVKRIQKVEDHVKNMTELTELFPLEPSFCGYKKIFQTKLPILFRRYYKAVANGIIDEEGNFTEEYTLAVPEYTNTGGEYTDEESEYTNTGAEYTDEEPEYTNTEAEYTNEEPEYTDEGHGYTEEGHGYTDEGQGYTDDGQEYTEEGQEYTDEGQGYTDEGHGYTDEGQEDADEFSEDSDQVDEVVKKVSSKKPKKTKKKPPLYKELDELRRKVECLVIHEEDED